MGLLAELLLNPEWAEPGCPQGCPSVCPSLALALKSWGLCVPSRLQVLSGRDVQASPQGSSLSVWTQRRSPVHPGVPRPPLKCPSKHPPSWAGGCWRCWRWRSRALGTGPWGLACWGPRPRTGTSHESSGWFSRPLARDGRWTGVEQVPLTPQARTQGSPLSGLRAQAPLPQLSPLPWSFLTRYSSRAAQPLHTHHEGTSRHPHRHRGGGPGFWVEGTEVSSHGSALTTAHQAHAYTCSPRLLGPWAGLWPPVCSSLSLYPHLPCHVAAGEP